MGAKRSTTLMMIINVVVLGATTTIGVVATELFTYLPTDRERVEKVGFELVATTNRALNGPEAACLVSFGVGPGVRMATKGVFQQPGSFSEVRTGLRGMASCSCGGKVKIRES
jgi:hypothetical protein